MGLYDAMMRYGTSIPRVYRQLGLYAGTRREHQCGARLAGIDVERIMLGAAPAALPVIQSTKFELIINIATAKAFGLAVPNKLMALADEVIE